MNRLLLDDEDFSCLVRGGILKIPKLKLEIALSDIGFGTMYDKLSNAVNKIDTYKNHTQDSK